MGYDISSVDHYVWLYKKDEPALLQHLKDNWKERDRDHIASTNDVRTAFTWYDWECETGNDEDTGEEITVLFGWGGDRLGDMDEFFETCAKYLHGYARWRGQEDELFEWRFENGKMKELNGEMYFGDLTEFFIDKMKDELPEKILKELEQWQTARKL